MKKNGIYTVLIKEILLDQILHLMRCLIHALVCIDNSYSENTLYSITETLAVELRLTAQTGNKR